MKRIPMPGIGSMHCLLGGLLLVVGVLVAAPSHASVERILSFDAEIAITTDGSMTVIERIRVHSEGRRIRHGITRDFPTEYRDRLGNRYHVDFTVLEVSRDGEPEDWHQKAIDNGVRVYLGNKHVELAPGDYDYSIRYRTNRQLGFFDDHDELYWNATGNGWDFAIEAASASIRLPTLVPAAQLRAFGYTGEQGSQEQALTTALENGTAMYAATRALAPGEGLSVVLEFPKGVIAEPAAAQRVAWLLRDNRSILIALGGLILLWLYYAWAWNRWGRDPQSGVRIPLYEPPRGESPAALRYVYRMGYDRTCFSAAILGLAAKGALDIEQDADEKFTLQEKAEVTDLRPEERALQRALFASGDELVLERSEHQRVSKAGHALRAALAKGYEKKYFLTHGWTLLPGVLLSLLTLIGTFESRSAETLPMVLFLLAWLSIWTLACIALASAAGAGRSGALWIGAGIFMLFEAAALITLTLLAGVAFMLVFLLLIGTNAAFYSWMKAPTEHGARLLDGIEGFRWYLGVAEKQQLDARYQPDSRPELFARFLPYAVALDLGNAWERRFAEALSPAQLEQARPTWYHGSTSSAGLGLGGFSSGLGSSLSSAISSSSSTPGSSSGSSGGGSGGGGGGGGGGGW